VAAEYDAAAEFGLIPDPTLSIDSGRNWFCVPRPARATMVAHIQIKALTSGISQLDQADFWERYAEQRAKAKGK
jgi:hypothetical protein